MGNVGPTLGSQVLPGKTQESRRGGRRLHVGTGDQGDDITLRKMKSDRLVKSLTSLRRSSHFNLLIISIDDKFRRFAPEIEVREFY